MSDVPAGSFVPIGGLYARARSQAAGEAAVFLEEAADAVDELLQASPDCRRLWGARTALRYEHAKLGAASDEVAAAAELRRLLEAAKPHATEPEVVYVALRVVNYLAYLLTKRGDLEGSRAVLELGSRIHDEFKALARPPFTGDDLLQEADVVQPGDDADARLDSLQTNNLQMLGYVHNKLGDLDAFVRCHHAVLCRQLVADDLDAPTWACKVARLASHFLDENRFGEARHHLAAASAVLDRCGDACDGAEALRARRSVSWCWVKYVLGLFSVSRSSVLEQVFDEQCLGKLWETPPCVEQFVVHEAKPSSHAVVSEILEELWGAPRKPRVDAVTAAMQECKVGPEGHGAAQGDAEGERGRAEKDKDEAGKSEVDVDEAAQGDGENAKKACAAEPPEFVFPGLDTDFLEDTVLATYIETAQQARELFRFAQAHWRQAEGPREDFADAMVQMGELYHHLAFYEGDAEGQYAAQRCRAEALRSSLAGGGQAGEQLRELVESEVELVRLNLRRIFHAPGDALRKMVALQDLHARLGLLSAGGLPGDTTPAPAPASATPSSA